MVISAKRSMIDLPAQIHSLIATSHGPLLILMDGILSLHSAALCQLSNYPPTTAMAPSQRISPLEAAVITVKTAADGAGLPVILSSGSLMI